MLEDYICQLSFSLFLTLLSPLASDGIVDSDRSAAGWLKIVQFVSPWETRLE